MPEHVRAMAEAPAAAEGRGSSGPRASTMDCDDDTAMREETRRKLLDLITSFPEQQQQLWIDVERSSGGDPQTFWLAKRRWEASVTLDQKLAFQRVLNEEHTEKVINGLDIDPCDWDAMLFWIEGRDFGSEVNNLISAALYCQENGIFCIVEDEGWVSGRLHDYLEVEPLILRTNASAMMGERMMQVKRNKQVVTPGWFAVQKHAKGVDLEKKSQFARRMWKYTPATRRAIENFNKKLAIVCPYIAVQIRRGDQTIGQRRETHMITIRAYALKAFEQLCRLGEGCNTVVVCTDDSAAAEEFSAELSRSEVGVNVRWRERASHREEQWSGLPFEERVQLTQEFLADLEIMRAAEVCISTLSSDAGHLVALLRSGPTESLDAEWTNA